MYYQIRIYDDKAFRKYYISKQFDDGSYQMYWNGGRKKFFTIIGAQLYIKHDIRRSEKIKKRNDRLIKINKKLEMNNQKD